MRKIFSTAELVKATGLSRERIRQLRGVTSKEGRNYKATLAKGVDWYWEEGKIVYTVSALKKLKELKRGKK